jgi:hypothetical protein
MRIQTFLVISLFCLICNAFGCAADVSLPPMPAEFYGTVYIENNPAPVGTTVTALINGILADELTITEVGVFGGRGIFDKRLSVTAEDAPSGSQTIQFLVNGIPIERTEEFAPGTSKQIALIAPDVNAKESLSSPIVPTITPVPSTIVPTLREVQTIQAVSPFISYDPYYPPNQHGYPDLQNERIFTSGDGRAQVISYPGSEIKTAAGSTVQQTTIKRKSLEGIQTPDWLAYAGYGYEIVPTGLSFLPDATLIIYIDAGLFEANPMIMRYEVGTGTWMYIPSFADTITGTVRATITESGIYGVIIQDMAPTEVIIETPIPTPVPTPKTPIQAEQIKTPISTPGTTIPTTQVMVTPMQTAIPTPPVQGPSSPLHSNTIWYVGGGILLIIIFNIIVWQVYIYTKKEKRSLKDK